MTYADGSREIIDRRSLRTLGEVHDVPWKPKSGLYVNGSDRSVVNELIERGFLKESPVEFSNRRNISITERGRTLYDALIVIQSIWESDPDSDLFFEVSGGVPQRTDERTVAETPLESTNGPSEVSEVVGKEEVPQNGGNEVPDENEGESGDSDAKETGIPEEEGDATGRSEEGARCRSPISKG